MRLVNRDKYISGIPCTSITDSIGNLLVTPLQVKFTSDTPIILTSFSLDETTRRYSLVLPDIVDCFVGEEIILYGATFTYSSNVARISIDGLTIQLPVDFRIDENIDITKVLFTSKFIIYSDEVEEGLYYTDYGELLYIADKFDYAKLVTLDDIRTANPILRSNRATEDWELENIKRMAFDTVMGVLTNYEPNSVDRYLYLNGDIIKNLVITQVMIGYLETLPLDITGRNNKLDRKTEEFNSILRSWLETYKINTDSEIADSKDELLLLQY